MHRFSSLSGESTIDAAAQRLYGLYQISGSGITRTRINGLSAGMGSFTAQTEQGELEGAIAFIEYEARIYQLIGYSGSKNWNQYRGMVDDSLRSFVALTGRTDRPHKPAGTGEPHTLRHQSEDGTLINGDDDFTAIGTFTIQSARSSSNCHYELSSKRRNTCCVR